MTRLIVRNLGCDTAYDEVFRAMRTFTDIREESTPDELWLTEHAPVFTQGQAGRDEYLLAPGDIPVVQSDRGGQVTYHGPGQIVGYLMFDLRRLGLNVRTLVRNIEASLVALLADYGITAAGRADAPGVYVGRDKIAALGLRVRRGYSYHGLSLNVDMDLAPYARIVACGLMGTGVTSMATLTGGCSVAEVTPRLVATLATQYGFDEIDHVVGPHQGSVAASGTPSGG
ncbi:MAG: lipoyl(octanoyl) transferase LipB [Gammaproteobacteria bacterium]|nr:lipoyl(octanoyl) transferase LipB [Gammaproteobacteria bacterium]